MHNMDAFIPRMLTAPSPRYPSSLNARRKIITGTIHQIGSKKGGRMTTIKKRERAVLGTVSFIPPLVADTNTGTKGLNKKETSPKSRREQVLKAQRYGYGRCIL